MPLGENMDCPHWKMDPRTVSSFCPFPQGDLPEGAHSWCSVNAGYYVLQHADLGCCGRRRGEAMLTQDFASFSTRIHASRETFSPAHIRAPSHPKHEEAPDSSPTPPCSPFPPTPLRIPKAGTGLRPGSPLAFSLPWNQSLEPCESMQSTLWKWFTGFLENLSQLPRKSQLASSAACPSPAL